MTSLDYVDVLLLLANTPAEAESLLYSREKAAGGIGFYLKTNKTKYIYFKRKKNHPHFKW